MATPKIYLIAKKTSAQKTTIVTQVVALSRRINYSLIAENALKSIHFQDAARAKRITKSP